MAPTIAVRGPRRTGTTAPRGEILGWAKRKWRHPAPVPPGGAVGKAAPNPANGHCIPAVGYDARNLYVITWGEVKPMSWPFYEAYADEAYAVLSRDFIKAIDGKSGGDGGFDLPALEKDLLNI